MKKRILSLILTLAMLLGCMPFQALATAPAQSVSSAEELAAAVQANQDIVLAADLNLGLWATPAGTYTGHFDGAGHTVSGLMSPLFNTIGGTVENLTIQDVFIERKQQDQSRSSVGALAERNEGTVRNIHLRDSGILGPGDGFTGGLIGYNTGAVLQSSNRGGKAPSGAPVDSWKGIRKIQGNGAVGGVVGTNNGGVIDECFNVDAVSSATGGHGVGYAGGVVGMNGNLGTVSHCYNRGSISNGTINSGGIAGRNKDIDNIEGFVTNSYHAGTVLGGNNNRVTTTYGYIDNCHYLEQENSGHPDGRNPEAFHNQEDAALANGLNAVSNFFTVENGKLQLLWETGKQPETPVLADKAALAAKLQEVAALTQESGSYTDDSWLAFLQARDHAAFANAYVYTAQELVNRCLSALETAHAGLRSNQPVVPETPEIKYDHTASNAEELKTALKAGGNIQLTADITLPESWNPGMLMNIFLLDGAGHTVTLGGKALFNDGVMNEIGAGCTVQNLVLAGTVNGKGSLADNNLGTIRNCVNRAAVTGDNAGGFVGVNWSKILYSVNYGTVTGAGSGSVAGKLQNRDGVAVTGCYGVGEKLLGQGTADETNALLTSDTDLEAAAAALNAQVTVNDISWKVENGVLALQTETIGGSGPVDPDVPVDPELTVVEIATKEEFYAALADLIMDESMSNQEGKKLVITADFSLPYESFRMPKGLNTILDGQGHTITLDKMSLVDEIGPKGEIRNLGLTGSAEGTSTGTFAPKSAGRIVNCWSTAIVNNNADNTIGGVVGVLLSTGSIENTYVAASALKGKNVGGLVGTVRPGSTIKNSYWLSGTAQQAYFRALDDMNMKFEYTGAEGCAAKTAEEYKSPAFLELLNANRGSNMQWNRSESGMPYFGEHVADLEVVEIADKDQFYAALADLIMDESMSNQEGKKLVITADFSIPYESFRMPKGLNTILDGQGHTITLEKMSLVDEIGPKGEIRNLGLVGSAEESATGAFAPKSAGRIVNCWSTAIVNHNADSTIGALVGQLLATGSIENSYAGAPVLKAKKIGGLVGTAREGSTIKNSYWMAGTASKAYFRALDEYDMSIDYTGAVNCAAKTDAEFKSPEFLELLNTNRGRNAKWTTGSNGYPQFTEGSSVNPGQGIEITLTLSTGKVITFNSADGLTVDPLDTLGRNNIGKLTCEGGVYWGIDYDLYGKNIMIGMENGDLYIYGTGTAVATVSGADGKALATFTITVPEQITVYDIRLTSQQGTMVDGALTVPGSTTAHIQPQIQKEEGGEWISVNPMYFTFTVHPEEAAQVVNNGITAVRPGTFTVTASGLGQEVTMQMTSEYVPITAIRPSPSGEYIIHERHAMVFEKYADFLDLNLSHGAGTVIIEPKYASNQSDSAYTFTFSDPAVADYVPDFVKGIRPLRAGTTDVTVTTLNEEHNVSGTTTIILKYRNPLTTIEVPETLTVAVDQSMDLPMVLSGSNPTAVDAHVSEPAMDWSFSSSDGGQVVITRTGMGIKIVEEGKQPYYVANDQYVIKGISAGTVTVTGTPWDTTGGAEPVTFTVTVTGDAQPEIDYVQMAKDDMASVSAWIIETQGSEYLYPDEWEIFSLLRSGATLEESGINPTAYLNSIEQTYGGTPKGKLLKPTELARVMLALTMLGEDASNFRGINFVDLLLNNKDIAGSGSNEAVWALIAMDTVNYAVPENAKWNRDSLIAQILTFAAPDGGFGLFSSSQPEVDMSGMAVQALAPYYHKGNDALDTAVDKAIAYMKNVMGSDCGHGSPEATAQVLTALTAMGIDPLDPANGFTLGRTNMITYIDSFKTADGGFSHVPDGASNGMAAVQVLYSLESWMRFLDGENRLYDLTDLQKQPEAPLFRLAGANVIMGNNLDMMFAIPAGAVSDWAGSYAVIHRTYADGRPAADVRYDFSDWEHSNGIYMITYHGIAAKEMIDELTVTVYDASGKAISQPWNDSLRAYAMRILNKSDKAAQKTLLVDMLNYGAEAQKHFGYAETNLANGLLSDEQKNLASEAKPFETKLDRGDKWVGSNLILESNIKLMMAFKDVTPGMTAQVSFVNHMGKTITRTFDSFEKMGNLSVLTIEDLVIADARQVLHVSVLNADGSVFTNAQESVEDYLARMNSVTPLFAAIMKFADSAHAYLHPAPAAGTVTISIVCDTILNNQDQLDPEKAPYVPEDGVILAPTQVTLAEGDTAYTVLQRICREKNIPMSAREQYNSIYVEGINNLFEFDCGAQSGWMYKVNEDFPGYSCGSYNLAGGENIVFCYTCDLGADVGNEMH